MKPKHTRLLIVLVSLLVMGGAAALLLKSFQDNLIFFYTPGGWHEKTMVEGFDPSREIRLGGIAEEVTPMADGSIRFAISDGSRWAVTTYYRGMLPSLFREGQGVVAQGKFIDGKFHATTILAKHDENYMPKEVVDALKQSGRWQP